MAIDATLPTDLDIISTWPGYIREIRALVNTIEVAETADLLPAITTIANADTSPSVSGAFALKTANAGATTIIFFDDGYEGQVIFLVAADAHTTIQHDTGLIYLTNQENRLLALGEALVLCFADGKWHEPGKWVTSTVQTVTVASYAIKVTDLRVKCNALANAITNTLPLAADVAPGHEVKVKKSDVSAYIVSIIRGGADTINDLIGAIELTLPNESVSFVSDGISEWTTFN